jgi:hypothetical protein
MVNTQIVINVYGGLVQDVSCSEPDAQAIVVDWDTEGSQPGEPGIVAVRGPLDREFLAHAACHEVRPLEALVGSHAEAAIEAANLDTAHLHQGASP